MWRIDTHWFDVAVVTALFAVGNILFGRFVEHQSRARRVLKLVVALVVTVTLAATAGRAWAYGVFALPLAAAIYVHGWWLPRHGVNGWTAEPRERYMQLVGAPRPGTSRPLDRPPDRP
jgi:hypothetical protein